MLIKILVFLISFNFIKHLFPLRITLILDFYFQGKESNANFSGGTVSRRTLQKMVRVWSKELLEEVDDGATPLLIFLLAEGVWMEDGSAENNPPPILFSDNLHVQCFATIEREGA